MNAVKYFCSMVLVFILGVATGVFSILRIKFKSQTDQNIDQITRNLNLVNQWLIIKMKGISLSGFLLKNNIKSIAIYGMGIYGRHLVRELLHDQIEICYGIDQKKMQPYMGVNVVQPVPELPKVDLIVNSVIYVHEEIRHELNQICKWPVISLEDLVFGSYENEKG